MKIKLLACVFAVMGLLPMRSAATPYLAIDNPWWDGSTPSAGNVGQDFPISGTALNSDVVHVWGFPSSGAVFLGAAFTQQAADAMRRTDAGGFHLMVRNAPIGSYTVVVYAHDPNTGGFPTWVALPLTVKTCQMFNVAWPFTGPSGPVSITLPLCAPQS